MHWVEEKVRVSAGSDRWIRQIQTDFGESGCWMVSQLNGPLKFFIYLTLFS